MTIDVIVNNIDILPEINSATIDVLVSVNGGELNLIDSITSTDNHILVDNTDTKNPSLSFQLVDNENLLTDDGLAKLDGIEAGAQVNAANTVIDASYVHTDNNLTDALVSEIGSALQSESDPVFLISPAASISSGDIENWSEKQDALTFSDNIEADKESTTKISAIKTFYDWAVLKFQAAKSSLELYVSQTEKDTWNGKQNAGSYELSTNKGETVTGNEISTTKYLSIKGVYDWATNLFAKLSGATFTGEVSAINGLKVTKIYPNADGMTAVQFTKADRTTVVFNIDTSGARPIIRIGTTSVAGSSTPTVFSLGGSYSTTKGYFPKLKLYDDGTNYFGLGVSANCYELMAPSDAYFSFVVNKIEKAKITSAGGLVLASSCQVGDDTAAASSANVGTTRYRVSGNNSYYETCMQTGASTYAWYINKQYSW